MSHATFATVFILCIFLISLTKTQNVVNKKGQLMEQLTLHNTLKRALCIHH